MTTVITVARKPLSGTVASNAQKHGTGGINIDASRIICDGGSPSQGRRQGVIPIGNYNGWGVSSRSTYKEEREGEKLGRWPANLILEHKLGCRCIGERQIPTGTCYEATGGDHKNQIYGQGLKRLGRTTGFANSDGTETIPSWECTSGCPVAEMDRQSGDIPTQKNRTDPTSKLRGRGDRFFGLGSRTKPSPEYLGDQGGASRFFYQVQKTEGESQTMIDVPQQLTDYLRTMISPPPRFGQVVVLMDLARLDWADVATWESNSIPGIVTRGEPTPEQSAELLRVLRPGAHLCVIAPEEEPMGFVGTCNVEDAGFEIRDAILWIREAGAFYYVPKPSRTEREAGCHVLPARTGAEAVNRKEGSAGMDSPRAGAGRTSEEIRNSHPTVKPIDIMESLLHDVPLDPEHPVVDPFTGSGTTGIACVRTGHPFIGIDMGGDYLKIADARIRYWAGEDMFRQIEMISDTPTDDYAPQLEDWWANDE